MIRQGEDDSDYDDEPEGAEHAGAASPRLSRAARVSEGQGQGGADEQSACPGVGALVNARRIRTDDR